MTTRPKTLTVDQCDQILNALCNRKASRGPSRRGIRNRTMALLMLDAGLRVGEVVALEMSDLYFDLMPVKQLTVRAAIAKTKTARDIALTERLEVSLSEFSRINEDWFELRPNRYAFEGNVPNKPLTTRQVERIVTRTAMKSIGKPVHPHIFRHTFASLLSKKTNIRTVQQLLGHKHITSTQIYVHPDQEDMKNAILTLPHSQVNQQEAVLASTSSPDIANSADTANAHRDMG